ncbi:MAG: diacylglyceryl transferase [Phycisphaerae bacterium]|nr:diacylglyceryl transferase [Phycisphaerae bacterium]
MELLRRILKVETNIQFVVVFLVFSITGMGAVFIAKPMMGWFGIDYEQMNWYVFWPLRILFMTVCYQIMLVTFGTLAGQRVYFWRVEKRMLRRFGIRLK